MPARIVSTMDSIILVRRQTRPSLRQASFAEAHHPLARAGDYVYGLSLPGFSGPDDPLVFVLRKVSDKLLGVAHYGGEPA